MKNKMSCGLVFACAVGCALMGQAGVSLDGGVFKDALYWYTGAVDRNGDGYLSQTPGDEIRNTLCANDTSNPGNQAYAAAGPLKAFQIDRATVKCPYSGLTIDNATVLRSRPGDYDPRAEGWVFVANASKTLNQHTSYTVLMRARRESGSPYYSVFASVGSVRFGVLGGEGPWIAFPGEDKSIGWWTSGEEWFDLAFVMNAEDKKAYVYAIYEGQNLRTEEIPYTQGYIDWTGGSVAAYLFSPDWTGPNGAFHQFAVWERALSAEEVKEAFSWPSVSDFKAQIGYRNGSADEFATLGALTAVSNSEPLSVYSHVFNAAHPELTTTFAMDKDHPIDLTEAKEGLGPKYAPRAQTIICHFAKDSGTGELEASVNGTPVGCETADPGDYVGYVVPASVVTDEMTLKLKWKSGGDIKLDAAYVAKDGDWQVGYANNSCFDDGFAGGGSAKYRIGDPWSRFGRALTGLGNGSDTNCVMTMSLTQEQVERFRYQFHVRWGNRTGDAGYNGVRVNGQLMATQFIGWGWYDTVVTIKPKDLVVGDNTIEIFRVDHEKDYGPGNYDQIDFVRFEPVKYAPKRGMLMIVR